MSGALESYFDSKCVITLSNVPHNSFVTKMSLVFTCNV